MERSIKILKDNMLKLIRKRREEAKLRVELVCDREEVNKGHSGEANDDSTNTKMPGMLTLLQSSNSAVAVTSSSDTV